MEQALQSFLDEVRTGKTPAGPPLLKAVWHGLRGEWDEAHEIAQADGSVEGAWVHAWLHRIEGDPSNAAYWYRRAGRAIAESNTTVEGGEIAGMLLGAPAGVPRA
jgi:hypothetical protein